MVFNDSDFDALRTDATYWFRLFELCIPRGNKNAVELELRYAGENNDAYQAQRLSSAFRDLAKRDADAALDKLLSETIIVGWRNVFATDGKTAIPYTPKDGQALLSQLRRVKRSDQIDRIQTAASFAPNFRAPLVDAVDLGNE